MPAGLSVALEGLTEHFYKNHQKVLQPISDTSTRKEIIGELKTVLSKYKANEHVKSFDVLISKLENLNSPTNKEKLKAPFRVLNIKLSKVDEETIEYRNDFLHGNINLRPRSGRKNYSMDSYEISLRLITLLHSLILKSIGYDGLIPSHVRIQRATVGNTTEEPYYRSLSK